MSYCAAADLYAFGVPRGATPNPARLVASVDTDADAFELDDHGFGADHPITLRAEAGGSLPAPLEAGTAYYVQPLSDASFTLAATAGGAAIDLTTEGARVLVISAPPIAEAIAFASRVIDDMLPAHLVPILEPIPEIIKITAAELAAHKLLGVQGGMTKTLTDTVDAARKRIERWATGVPIRGDDAPPRANLSATTAATRRRDPRGWHKYGGTE